MLWWQWHHGDLEKNKGRGGNWGNWLLRSVSGRLFIHWNSASLTLPGWIYFCPSTLLIWDFCCVHITPSPNWAVPTLRMWGECWFSLYPGVCESRFTLVCGSQLCAFLLSSMTYWNWSWWEYVQQGNWTILQIRTWFPPRKLLVKYLLAYHWLYPQCVVLGYNNCIVEFRWINEWSESANLGADRLQEGQATCTSETEGCLGNLHEGYKQEQWF